MNKVELMQKLLQDVRELQYGTSNVTSLIDKAKMYIKKCFGDTSEYQKRIDAISFHPIMFTTDTPTYVFVNSFNRGREELVSLIETMIEDIEISIAEEAEQKVQPVFDNAQHLRNVFIVHGHDEVKRTSVEAFVRSIGYNPIVLFKEPNKGQTIIEKIESNAEDICYAIVIYTACDLGKDKAKKKLAPRARQNVVFEHGYMCAHLGRSRVVALLEKGVEQPGDLGGVVYVEWDDAGVWRMKVAQEMHAIGLDIDFRNIKF